MGIIICTGRVGRCVKGKCVRKSGDRSIGI